MKEFDRVVGNLRITGKESQVRVKLRCLLMIVSGSEVRVAAYSFLFLSDDQCDLHMRLETHNSIDHMNTGVFQKLRPMNIAFFVKPGREFDQDHDLLSALRCP